MRVFLRSTSIIGCFFFGYFWFQSLYNIVTRNVFFDVFTLEQTSSSNVEYETSLKDSFRYHINYELIVEEKLFKGKASVDKKAFIEKFGSKPLELVIGYNKSLPSVNYIIGWRTKDSYVFIFVVFTLFFLFILFGTYIIKRYYQKYG